MNPKTIKKLENWLCKPLCFIFTRFRRVARIFSRREKFKHPVKKILFIKLVEQGAIVLAYTALRRAVSMVGRKNVFFCLFARNKEILGLLDIIPSENVLTIRAKSFSAFLTDVIKNLIKIRRSGIDATVDLEFFSRSTAILAYLSGAQCRVGLHRFTSEVPYRGDLMTHRIQYNPYLHHAKGYILLVEALKREPKEIPMLKISTEHLHVNIPKFKPKKEEKKRIQELVENNIDHKMRGPIVLLNPDINGLLPIRNWLEKKYIELSKKILSSYKNAILIFIGLPKAREGTENICRTLKSHRMINLAGKTSLRELLVLYVLSDVLISNDSGHGHFTPMADIKSVLLYGPETPLLFGVWSKHAHIIYNDLACSPCLNLFNHRFSPCTNNVCMQSISVERVYKEVQRCLLKRKK